MIKRNNRNGLNKKEAEVNSSSSLESVKNLIEVIGKIIIGLFAIFYAVGLIVVNLYLNKFGVYSLSLFRLNYVFAGIWAFVPVIIVFLAIILLVSFTFLISKRGRNFIGTRFGFTESIKNEPTKDTIISFIVMVFFFFFVIYFLYQTIDVKSISNDIWLSLMRASLVVGYIIIFLFLTFREQSHMFSRLIRAIISILICTVILTNHIVGFATGLYGKIPSYIGGGSPKKAQLVLKEESKIKEQLNRLQVIFEGDSTVTLNVQILLVTSEEYILLIEAKNFSGDLVLKGLTLNKENIQAVLFEEANFRGAGAGDKY